MRAHTSVVWSVLVALVLGVAPAALAARSATFVFDTVTDPGDLADGPDFDVTGRGLVDDTGTLCDAVTMVMVDAAGVIVDIDSFCLSLTTGQGGSDGDYGSFGLGALPTLGPITYALYDLTAADLTALAGLGDAQFAYGAYVIQNARCLVERTFPFAGVPVGTPFSLCRKPVIGTGAGTGGFLARTLVGAGGVQALNFLPYSPAFTGGVRVALGDVNGDGVPDIVTGAGPGGGPHVRVFDGTTGGRDPRASSPTPRPSRGGVFVAAGDVNGDGFADIITGAGAGGGPHVRVFSGATGAEIRELLRLPAWASPAASSWPPATSTATASPTSSPARDRAAGRTSGSSAAPPGPRSAGFFAYGAAFTGGVSVAAGDVNGDGKADIITGAGAGRRAARPGLRRRHRAPGSASFFAYGAGFTGGVFVAAGDVNGDGVADIITGAGPGGGPHVKVFDGETGAVLQSFFAYAPAFTGGVFVAGAD